MRPLLSYLQRLSFVAIRALALLGIGLVGLLDYFVGPDISTSLLYVVPTAIASWFGSRSFGYATAVLAALTWLITDIGSGKEYSHPAILFWNTFVRLGTFVVISGLVSAFRKRLDLEEHAADTDSLTGLHNARGFYERLEKEYQRSQRFNRVFSIAYIDIDNFKHINDTFGHASGDEVLNIVAETLRTNLRNVDVVARLGGDEFVVLLPETDSKEVKEAFRHAHRNLVEGFAKHSMPITFSIGVVSFDSCPESFKQAVQVADETMYSVKRKVKNNIVYQVWDGLEHKPMQ